MGRDRRSNKTNIDHIKNRMIKVYDKRQKRNHIKILEKKAEMKIRKRRLIKNKITNNKKRKRGEKKNEVKKNDMNGNCKPLLYINIMRQ